MNDLEAPRTLRLLVEYDGSRFVGWERQRNGLGIQEVLEQAFSSILGEYVSADGSGRTDAGVHALGQVVSVRSQKDIAPGKLVLALNAVLPPDVSVKEISIAADGFHARFSARSKTYRYSILNSRARSPLMRDRAYHFPRALDVGAMARAASCLVGTHDFSAFAKESEEKNCVRTIFRAEVIRSGDLVVFEVCGSGFLYNMVRILTGTLLEIGVGRRAPESMAELVMGSARADSGFTVSPLGLTLVHVGYPEDCALDPDRADA